MSLSRRSLLKIGAAVPLVGISVIAYSYNKSELFYEQGDPCVLAYFNVLTPEVNIETPASILALVLNRSKQARECVVELLANDVLVERKYVNVEPLDFAYVNLSYTPLKEGITFLGVANFEKILVARKPVPVAPVVEIPEELRKRFESLLPGVATFEIVSVEDVVYYKAFDKNNKLMGYLFETTAQGLSETLMVIAAISPEFKIITIDVEPAPDTPHTWKEEITTPKFENQFSGLSIGDLALKPQGKVDAVSGATISSKAVVEAIRKYLEIIARGG